MKTMIEAATRYFAPHEPGYWPAQRNAFATIAAIEDALNYESLFDQEIENQLHGELHSWSQSEIDAHVASIANEIAQLARHAALGHAVRIIRARQRHDETAQHILEAYRILTEPG